MNETDRITISPPATGDRTAWAALWRDYLHFYGTSRGDDVFDWTWDRIVTGDADMHGRLAFQGPRAVGLVHFLYHRSFWGPQARCYLNDLFVLPEARGSGIAAALIREVQGHAAARGAAQVYWLTAEDNATARRLYDRVATKTPFIKYMCEVPA